jgi:hypothetical protein
MGKEKDLLHTPLFDASALDQLIIFKPVPCAAPIVAGVGQLDHFIEIGAGAVFAGPSQHNGLVVNFPSPAKDALSIPPNLLVFVGCREMDLFAATIGPIAKRPW